MNKILLISYDFPPARTSGMYRPVKFVKHLKKFGWDPIVLTAKNPYVSAFDDSLLKDIPKNTKVFRAFSIDLAEINDIIYQWLFGKSHKYALVNSDHIDSEVTKKTPLPVKKKSWVKRWFFSPLNVFAQNWLYVPDSKVGWFPFALLKAIRIMWREKPDVVFSTSAPPTAQIIGFTLKLLFRKPWVVDFRDNWAVGYPQIRGSKKRHDLDIWLMKRVVRRADQIITMCEGNIDDLLRELSETGREKYQCITNGFDEDDFGFLNAAIPERNDDKLVLLHVGMLYFGTAGKFFKALSELQTEHPEIIQKVEINFIGSVPAEYKNIINALKLDSIIRFLGYRNHVQALQSMFEADLLLLFLGPDKVTNQQFPGKTFEYLRAQKTIFAVGRKGEIYNAINECRSGILVPFDDVDAIKKNLIRIYRDKIADKLNISPNIDCINCYEYHNLTRRFVEVLNKAINTGK